MSTSTASRGGMVLALRLVAAGALVAVVGAAWSFWRVQDEI